MPRVLIMRSIPVQGQLFINGFNVGRYWPVAGPQITLYVPAGLLRAAPETNQLVLLELESAPSSRDPMTVNTVEFVDKPLLNGRCFHTSQQTNQHISMSSDSVADPSSGRWNSL